MHRIGINTLFLFHRRNLNVLDNLYVTYMPCVILNKDQPYGWASDGEDNDYITWTAPMAYVQKVEIQFRDNRGGQHAQIADLEIYYCDSGSRVCQGDFLRVTSSADTSLCGQNQNEDASDWAGEFGIQVNF